MNPNHRQKRIAVIGAGTCDPETKKLADEVGWRIAKAGAILICGGMSGVMEAAAQGAKKGNGMTIGILPSYNPNDANIYIDIPISTGLGHARNVIVVASSDAVIAVGGEYGTLSEIALALKLNKPVIALKSWHLRQTDKIKIAHSPEEAVKLVFTEI